MADFVRELGKPLLDHLNEAYGRGEQWWLQILEDKELYLGIRNHYLDVYCKGNRLLKIYLRDAQLCVDVHYKYLLRPDKPSALSSHYVRFEHGQRAMLGDDFFISQLEDLKLLKRASEPYVHEEKKGVHEILKHNPNIVDVEIALAPKEESDEDSSEGDKKQSKVDFAALQHDENRVRLVFFEAKHFANGELRAGDGGKPKVIEQIQRYVKIIDKRKEEIVRAYRQVCADFCTLEGVRPELKRHAKLVTPDTTFEVDGFPRLVIFGFDEDQQRGKTWQGHQGKLENGAAGVFSGLGKSRVLTKGKPSGFAKGISSAK